MWLIVITKDHWRGTCFASSSVYITSPENCRHALGKGIVYSWSLSRESLAAFLAIRKLKGGVSP